MSGSASGRLSSMTFVNPLFSISSTPESSGVFLKLSVGSVFSSACDDAGAGAGEASVDEHPPKPKATAAIEPMAVIFLRKLEPPVGVFSALALFVMIVTISFSTIFRIYN